MPIGTFWWAVPARQPALPDELWSWHYRRVDEAWNLFVVACQRPLGELVEGRSEPFKSLWSHADDVVIMGAFGGHERGWQQVSARLDRAAKGIASTGRRAENLVTVVGDDLAYTVDLEHMTRNVGDRPRPRTLRCTQAYRRESGQWKVVLRHADELPRTDEQQQ
jgi:ketosteroid isomerase-like protein